MAGGGGFLPFLLIAAVLLCHGVLGAVHQIWCDDACGPTQASKAHHGSASGTEGTGETGDGPTGGLGTLSYAAVVLAAFGAASLLGLLLAVRRWCELEVRRPVFRRRYPLSVAHRPRGPTLPSLQVFRL